MKALFPKAEVYGVEHMKELAEKSMENIAKFANRFDTNKIHVIHGDGKKELVEHQPFDFIHCGAGKLNFFLFFCF